jgi:hypothetical protein
MRLRRRLFGEGVVRPPGLKFRDIHDAQYKVWL